MYRVYYNINGAWVYSKRMNLDEALKLYNKLRVCNICAKIKG